jgi:hypothetical protein
MRIMARLAGDKTNPSTLLICITNQHGMFRHNLCCFRLLSSCVAWTLLAGRCDSAAPTQQRHQGHECNGNLHVDLQQQSTCTHHVSCCQVSISQLPDGQMW